MFQGNTIRTAGYTAFSLADGSNNVDFLDNDFSNNASGLRIRNDGYGWGAPIGVEAHGNSFANNTLFGLEVISGAYVGDVNAEKNYWGAESGPGPVGPGTGAKVSTNVDYQPWCNVDFSRCSYYPMGTISMQTSGTPAEVGDIVTMDSLVTVDGVYGMQLRVSFDATELEFQAAGSLHNDVSAAGWFWDSVPENFIAVTGGRRLSGSMTSAHPTPAHPNPATLTGQSVATWKFKCSEGRHLEPNLRSDA